MKVYPWRQRDNQGDRKMVMKVATSSAVVFRIVGGMLSFGVASLTGLILVRRFANRNDSWIKRGALMTLVGLLVFVVLGGPASWAGALSDVLMSFGDKTDVATTPALAGFLIRSIAFGFFFQGFAVMMASYVYEVTGNRFLDRVKPTTRMKRRRSKNETALVQNDKPHDESIAFGVIVDDPIPWRTARYGMICARPMKDVGHGAIVGSTGTGKTVTAISLAYQAAMIDSAVFYTDFKASLRTLETLKQAAAKAGKKFYSFDLGTGSTETSWYDPLDWQGTSSEKASMVVNSLEFTEDGSAAYYRGQANDWLIFQFDVLAEVGLHPGESSFDFLLETANPAKMKDRLRPLRGGDPRQRDMYTSLHERADAGSWKDLTSLRQNLSIVVNSGGERLRPQSDAPAILMSRAVEEGAVVYFGLSPSTDLVALKTIGSLILRNLGVLSGERMRQKNLGSLRPVVTLVDEASRLQDRAVVLDNVLATAREAEIYLWMITQSFSTWPKSTIVEMTTNVWTYVAFRVQDTETAETLVSTLEDVPVLEEMTEDKVRHRAFQGDVKERSGDARTTTSTGPFLADAPMGITSMDDLHAYVWFTGSWTRATIEKWSPKRLKKPDTIRNDAPLVRIVFMDYDTDAEPIQGTTFSDLVTPADEIAYNMENTTLKRSRKESLTDDDYSHIHLPGADDDDVQWADDAPADARGHVAARGRGNEMGGPRGTQDEPRWDDQPTPANTTATAPGTPTGEEGLTWADDPDSDVPPVAHFYKAGTRGRTEPPVSPVVEPVLPETGPGEEEFAEDTPTVTPQTQGPSAFTDDDGLVWEGGPVEPPGRTPPPVPDESAPFPTGGDEFAPDRGEEDAMQEAPAVEDTASVEGPAPEESIEDMAGAVPTQDETGQGAGGDASEGYGYTEPSSHDADPTSSPDTGTPVRFDARDVKGEQEEHPSSASPSDAPASTEAGGDAAQDEGTQGAGSAETYGEGEPQEASTSGAPGASRKRNEGRGKKNASDDWM